jgi:hypothetical protein
MHGQRRRSNWIRPRRLMRGQDVQPLDLDRSGWELVSGGFDDDDLHAWRVGNVTHGRRSAAIANLLDTADRAWFYWPLDKPIGTDLPDAQSQLAYKRLEIALNALRSVP